MYREHFGLSTNPFGLSPRLDFIYRSGAFAESMAHLVYGLDNNEAIVMITGAIGTGKTMALQSFLSCLGDRYVSALVTNTKVDGKELLKLVLEDLDCDVKVGADKSDLLIGFKQCMLESAREGKRIVIVIDEAQNLGLDVLEEIRLLTNLGQGEEQPVQIILVGQPELEATVARPDQAQLRQRIRIHYKLCPLSRHEVREYVDHRMTVAGGEHGVFGDAALDRIFAMSGGVPRVVNTLCDRALLSAYVAGRRKVDVADLEESASAPAAPAPPAMPPSMPVPPAPRPAEAAAVVEDGDNMAVRRGPATGPAAPDPRMPVSGHERRSAANGSEDAPRSSSRRAGPLVVGFLVVACAVAAVVYFGVLRPSGAREPGTSSAVIAPDTVRTAVTGSATPDSVAAAADTSVSLHPAASAAPDSAQAPLGDGPAQDATVQPVPATVPSPRREIVAEGTAGASAATSEADSCYLHVSSFKTAEHAQSVVRQFETEGVPGRVARQEVQGVVWYRVYLGPFSGRRAAVAQADALIAAGKVTYYRIARTGAVLDS